MRHWEYMRKKYNEKNPDNPEPASAWLFNSIINKHADAMDNYPQPNILPREESDKEVAEQLSAIMPVILEQNDYEQIYSDAWWYKLKTGTAVYGVFWNAGKENGLGDVEISNCDILNLFWEPGIRNIQDSRYVFYVSLVDNEVLEEQYSQTRVNSVLHPSKSRSTYMTILLIQAKNHLLLIATIRKTAFCITANM